MAEQTAQSGEKVLIDSYGGRGGAPYKVCVPTTKFVAREAGPFLGIMDGRWRVVGDPTYGGTFMKVEDENYCIRLGQEFCLGT